MTKYMIIVPFNAAFFICFAAFAALLVGSAVLLRKKDVRVRGRVLAVVMLANFLLFWYYKIALSLDAPYSEICAAAGKGGFSWWEELPFHLCNVNMMLIPAAALTRWRPLCSFCFFLAPLGAFMALIMPAVGFSGYSLFLPRMLGYYITHLLIMAGGIDLAAYGLYRPRFRDFPFTILTAMSVAFVGFVISEAFRYAHLSDHVNYFFAVESEGNPILSLFYRIIPLPYLYLIPCSLILLPYMFLVTGGFWLYEKRHGAPAQQA